MHVGPDYFRVNISLHIVSRVDRPEAHAIFEDIDDAIEHRYPRVKRVFIESERNRTAPDPEPRVAG